MYIFNPEHDLCIANGDIHFVPPQSALAFGRDCADIIKFMYGLDSLADQDNSAGADQDCSADAAHSAAAVRKIMPWGWNSVLCNRLRKQGVPEELLPNGEKLRSITELSHRSVAHDAHEYVCASGDSGLQQSYSRLLPSAYRIAARSLEEVEEFLAKHKNVVLKAPLSGSGKGIRFVSGALSHSDAGWCSNLIAKFGYVPVEKRCRLVLEFAMLFRCKESAGGRKGAAECDAVEFVGYSLFYTQNGAYRGNVLGSNEFIKREICRFVPQDMLEQVKGRLMDFLRERVCGRYEGYVGVDQFVCSEFYGLEDRGVDDRRLWFHPVVEINLRMTMGLIARNIYDRFAQEYNLSDGSKCFEICRDKIEGKMVYSYRIAQVSRR